MQTLIQNITQTGSRLYLYRMLTVGHNTPDLDKLSVLNKKLDTIYRKIYHYQPTISSEDTDQITGRLSILLSTVKDLIKSLKGYASEKEVENLRMNYSALYELNSDLENFKSQTSDLSELHHLLSQASETLSTVTVEK